MYLTEEEKIVFDWQYGRLGDFFMLLCNAISIADFENLAKLSVSFPTHVRAIKRYQTDTGWWESIQKKWESIQSERNT